jgi:D-alanyl-D-alanine carboxypeptidase (penicillin-binding protein 5/6)
MTLDDLLTGTLLRSANDGAVCIAETVAGSEAKFVDMMNRKAKEIGANDTHFINPHGLYVAGHYSTAYDLALIARYGIQIPEFNRIVKTKTVVLDRSIDKKDRFVKNTARFLWKFDGADGIKTGYTREAGHCFVGSATRNGWRLISVVMKSKDPGMETISLMNYGFRNFKGVTFIPPGKPIRTVPVVGGVRPSVAVQGIRPLGVVMRRQDRMDAHSEVVLQRAVAPIIKGEKLGTLTAYLNGKKIDSIDLVAMQPVARTLGATIWAYTRIVGSIIGVILLGCVGYGRAIAKTSRSRRRSVQA